MPLCMKIERKRTRRRREEIKKEEIQKYLKTTEELSYIEENLMKEKWQRNKYIVRGVMIKRRIKEEKRRS